MYIYTVGVNRDNVCSNGNEGVRDKIEYLR